MVVMEARFMVAGPLFALTSQKVPIDWANEHAKAEEQVSPETTGQRASLADDGVRSSHQGCWQAFGSVQAFPERREKDGNDHVGHEVRGGVPDKEQGGPG